MENDLETLRANANGKEGSFIFELTEKETFSKNKFDAYLKSLKNIADKAPDVALRQEAAAMAIKVHGLALSALIWHYAAQDEFQLAKCPEYPETAKIVNDLNDAMEALLAERGGRAKKAQ